jgi:hypothetical protein
MNVANLWRIPPRVSDSVSSIDKPSTSEPANKNGVYPASRLASEPAWRALMELHKLLGYRIRITFSVPSTATQSGASPNPVEANLTGIATELIEDFPQPFLLLENVQEVFTVGGHSSAPWVIFDTKRGLDVVLFAEVAQIERVGP